MIPDLLSTSGLEAYRDGDEAFFLRAAGQEIRDFCGWHVAPSVTVTESHDIARGLIVLPTLHLTGVASIGLDDHQLPDDEYSWGSGGGIEVHTVGYWPAALVTYTHGHQAVPDNVATIGYELAQRALDTVGGNTKDFGAGPYRISLRSLGVELDPSQRRRLAANGYQLPGVR